MSDLAFTARSAADDPSVTLLRELVRAYQAFHAYDARQIRERGLTVAQADVVFTLGNTQGMNCKELGQRTLITKGALTGVLDRLEAEDLIERAPGAEDRRQVLVRLTRKGERTFERVFPAHIAALSERFSLLSSEERDQATALLRRIRDVFQAE